MSKADIVKLYDILDAVERIEKHCIPWTQIVAMRHILVHEYEGIDPSQIIKVLKHNIRPLKQAVQTLIQKLDPDGNFK